jgi:hypothetical protein
MTEKKIYYTKRVYNNNDETDNFVKPEDIADHEKYNLTYRPGTAFFVNGVCKNEGYLGKERCDVISQRIIEGMKEGSLDDKFKEVRERMTNLKFTRLLYN